MEYYDKEYKKMIIKRLMKSNKAFYFSKNREDLYLNIVDNHLDKNLIRNGKNDWDYQVINLLSKKYNLKLY